MPQVVQSKTPRQLGYRMPAEWEPHAATWLTWPRPDGISFPDKYDTVPPVYAEFIRALVAVEEVHINVWNAEMEQWVRKLLIAEKTPIDRVRFHQFPAYEPWCRDHGPIFLVRDQDGHRERAIVDWGYNAWGGKYPPFDLDDAIPQHVARFRDLPMFAPQMVLEGGSIEVNGAGTCLTTEQCLLNRNRNPRLTQAQIEDFLKDSLGVSHVIWLGEGIVGDDTDGHIDDIARFVNPTTVTCIVEANARDENYRFLEDNHERLQNAVDQNGAKLSVVKLPCPDPVYDGSVRLPASYANFYVANEVVLVPIFDDAHDVEALGLLQELFPNRKVHGLRCHDVVAGLGAIHCVTQQQPQPPL